jgi:hypothetical protein
MLMLRKILITAALLLPLGGMGTLARADDRPYTEGNVVQVAGIRTEYGHFDDYMRFLDTNWKQEMEAAKKEGLIVSYSVYTVEPRGADDPDVYLVTTFKNWAAFDGLGPKMDALATKVYGSVSKSDQSAVDRAKIRRTLGVTNMQQLVLK